MSRYQFPVTDAAIREMEEKQRMQLKNARKTVRKGDTLQGKKLLRVQDEGTTLPRRKYLNFVGDGVEATDDEAGDRTNVTVEAGGGGGGFFYPFSRHAELEDSQEEIDSDASTPVTVSVNFPHGDFGTPAWEADLEGAYMLTTSVNLTNGQQEPGNPTLLYLDAVARDADGDVLQSVPIDHLYFYPAAGAYVPTWGYLPPVLLSGSAMILKTSDVATIGIEIYALNWTGGQIYGGRFQGHFVGPV